MLEIVLVPALSDNYVYLLRDSETGTVAVVDPGTAAPVQAALEARGWGLDLILNTHHHADHTGGNADLKARHGVRVVGPRAERGRIATMDDAVAEGDAVQVGAAAARVIETPGHTAGHISLYFADQHALFCGDTLFALGCGRLFEGSAADMWTSLSKLRALPDETAVYCGHEYTAANVRFAVTVDPGNAALARRADEIRDIRQRNEPTIPTTIGLERKTNPFLRADVPAVADAVGLPDGDPVAVFAAIRARKDAF